MNIKLFSTYLLWIITFLFCFSFTKVIATDILIYGYVYSNNSSAVVANQTIYFTDSTANHSDSTRSDTNGFYWYNFDVTIDTSGVSQLYIYTYDCIINGKELSPFNITNSTDSIFYNLEMCETIDEQCKAAFKYYHIGNQGVEFENTSQGDIVEYFWRFGDGQNSYDPNPQHYYEQAGIYHVTLQILTSVQCIDSVDRYITITEQKNEISCLVSLDTMLLPLGKALIFASDTILNDTPIKEDTSVLVTSGWFTYEYKHNKYSKIQVIPTVPTDLNYAPEFFPTYFGNAIYWEDAYEITPNLFDTMSINLVSRPGFFYGNGSISGKIWPGENNTVSYENICVFLLDQSELPVKYSYAKLDSTFILKNIPDGNYKLLVNSFGVKAKPMPINLTREKRYISIEFALGDFRYTGLNNKQEIESTIFPNPFTSSINIKLKYLHKDSFVTVYNSMGQLISSESISKNLTDYKLNLSHIEKGIYYIKIGNKVSKAIKI